MIVLSRVIHRAQPTLWGLEEEEEQRCAYLREKGVDHGHCLVSSLGLSHLLEPKVSHRLVDQSTASILSSNIRLLRCKIVSHAPPWLHHASVFLAN